MSTFSVTTTGALGETRVSQTVVESLWAESVAWQKVIDQLEALAAEAQ